MQHYTHGHRAVGGELGNVIASEQCAETVPQLCILWSYKLASMNEFMPLGNKAIYPDYKTVTFNLDSLSHESIVIKCLVEDMLSDLIMMIVMVVISSMDNKRWPLPI